MEVPGEIGVFTTSLTHEAILPNTYIYIYTHIVYIYIERERQIDREREREKINRSIHYFSNT